MNLFSGKVRDKKGDYVRLPFSGRGHEAKSKLSFDQYFKKGIRRNYSENSSPFHVEPICLMIKKKLLQYS